MASLEEAGELGLPDQGLKRTLKDLFAGAVGGVAQVLLGMLILAQFLLMGDVQDGGERFRVVGKLEMS